MKSDRKRQNQQRLRPDGPGPIPQTHLIQPIERVAANANFEFKIERKVIRWSIVDSVDLVARKGDASAVKGCLEEAKVS